MFVAQLYGEDHDDTESRILELWQEAPAFSATVEVTVDGKVVGPDEFTNLCRQWRELLAQVRLDIEREQGAG